MCLFSTPKTPTPSAPPAAPPPLVQIDEGRQERSEADTRRAKLLALNRSRRRNFSLSGDADNSLLSRLSGPGPNA